MVEYKICSLKGLEWSIIGHFIIQVLTNHASQVQYNNKFLKLILGPDHPNDGVIEHFIIVIHTPTIPHEDTVSSVFFSKIKKNLKSTPMIFIHLTNYQTANFQVVLHEQSKTFDCEQIFVTFC